MGFFGHRNLSVVYYTFLLKLLIYRKLLATKIQKEVTVCFPNPSSKQLAVAQEVEWVILCKGPWDQIAPYASISA